MFFIMGISQGQKQLNFDQMIVCRHCGRYGHLQVYMVYSYLSLFFIPVFRWGRQYYAKTTCCNTTVPLEPEQGRQIARGELTSLPETIIPDTYRYTGRRLCSACGFEAESDYQFCPKCGKPL